MAEVQVEVNGRPYVVGCEDGQEGHVRALADGFDAQVREVAGVVGQLGEARLFLMAALMVADEMGDVRARLAQAQGELGRLQSDHARSEARSGPRNGTGDGAATAEARAAQALDAAARRIETLADALADGSGPAG